MEADAIHTDLYEASLSGEGGEGRHFGDKSRGTGQEEMDKQNGREKKRENGRTRVQNVFPALSTPRDMYKDNFQSIHILPVILYSTRHVLS
jgi:hypothetical protein